MKQYGLYWILTQIGGLQPEALCGATCAGHICGALALKKNSNTLNKY